MSQVRRNGPYAPLSAFYADDDAIATLDMAEDDRTELLFVRALAYCAREPRLNGFISDVALGAGRVLRRRPRKGEGIERNAKELHNLGLWLREEDGYRIKSWGKWNRSAEEIDAARKRDRERKESVRKGDDDA